MNREELKAAVKKDYKQGYREGFCLRLRWNNGEKD